MENTGKTKNESKNKNLILLKSETDIKAWKWEVGSS